MKVVQISIPHSQSWWLFVIGDMWNVYSNILNVRYSVFVLLKKLWNSSYCYGTNFDDKRLNDFGSLPFFPAIRAKAGLVVYWYSA